jgi:hypothetical protein
MKGAERGPWGPSCRSSVPFRRTMLGSGEVPGARYSRGALMAAQSR